MWIELILHEKILLDSIISLQKVVVSHPSVSTIYLQVPFLIVFDYACQLADLFLVGFKRPSTMICRLPGGWNPKRSPEEPKTKSSMRIDVEIYGSRICTYIAHSYVQKTYILT